MHHSLLDFSTITRHASGQHLQQFTFTGCAIAEQTHAFGDTQLAITKAPNDAENTCRLWLKAGELSVELLPSKGLSIGQAFYGTQAFFWEPPISGLSNPDTVDFFAPLMIAGKQTIYRAWAGYFMGGVEMLGLKNWGLPESDEFGHMLPLHGEVSNLASAWFKVDVYEHGVEVTAHIPVYYAEAEHQTREFYKHFFTVVKKICVVKGQPSIYLVDQIINELPRPQKPSWGYHVQLRVEPECRYLIPSKQVAMRGGKPLPEDHETYRYAQDPSVREEYGFIHKSLKTHQELPLGIRGVDTLMRYKDGSGIKVTLPHTAYLQTWMSSGGFDEKGFGNKSSLVWPATSTQPARDILSAGWNGYGPEIGSSALDHDGNIDPEATHPLLAPQERVVIPMIFSLLDAQAAESLAMTITKFNQQRN